MTKTEMLELNGKPASKPVMITDDNLVLDSENDYNQEVERYIGHRIPKLLKNGWNPTHICSWVWLVQPSRFAECESGLGIYKTHVIYTNIITGEIKD